MTLTERIVNAAIKGLVRVICRVDDAQLKQVPARGPLILIANHINFLDAPLIYTHLRPRPLAGFAKIETWDNPILGFLFSLYGAIPLQRGEVDKQALRRGLEALKAGDILAVAPEGTRSGHGRLQRGHAGVVMLALRSGAPILPFVYYGGEKLRQNIRRLRRTDFHIVVGNLFYLDDHGERVTREIRQKMVDEIMYQIAALLPPLYRGVYANIGSATEMYLRFPPDSQSNLRYVVPRRVG
jgi:1-acyl-sn-glycerol-3-phosphate acyltransferase